jgi:hypothetical protein
MTRYFRIVRFRKKKEPIADLVARVLAATGEPGRGCSRVLFDLVDKPSQLAKVSAVSRAIRAYPQLRPFAYEGPVSPTRRDSPRYLALGNFAPPWDKYNPTATSATVSVATLIEVLRGIPKRFPFWRASITVDGVAWSTDLTGLSAAPAADDRPPVPGYGWYLYPSVTLNDNLATDFEAVVEVTHPERPLPPDVRARIEAIGRPDSELMRVRFEGAELASHLRTRAAASAFAEAFSAGYQRWLRTNVHLPEALPPEADASMPVTGPLSAKKSLTAALRPLGYRYHPGKSGYGGYHFEKRTPLNHHLIAEFDLAPIAKSLTGGFLFSGIEKRHAIKLPAYPEQTTDGYRVTNQRQIDMVVANWAAMVRALEVEFVPALEAIYGPDPAWA